MFKMVFGGGSYPSRFTIMKAKSHIFRAHFDAKFQNDPGWRDLILFYEYFHGENLAGIGASHQTGWTGPVAWSIKSLAVLNPDKALNKGFDVAAMRMQKFVNSSESSRWSGA